MRAPPPLAIVLALGLVATPAHGLQANGRGSGAEVGSVRFEGNATFPGDSLARAIATRATECRSTVFLPFCWLGADFAVARFEHDPREVSNDLRRLQIWYQRRGFREVRVDTATTVAPDGEVAVTFRITEGTPVVVRSVEYAGADSTNDAELLAGLPLRPGDRLSSLRLDATRDTLRRRLWNSGYARGDVLRGFRIPREDPYGATVRYDVQRGPFTRFGPISVEGLQSLDAATVQRVLPFEAGSPFSAAQMLEGQALLFGMDVVTSATVDTLSAGADSVFPVRVVIREGDVHRLRGGGGWSNAECVDVESRWVSRNFLGGGRTFQVRGRIANVLATDFHEILCPQSGGDPYSRINWLAAVDFAQPWIFSTRNALAASLFGERQSLPDVFVRRAIGLDVSLTRALDPRTPLRVSYGPELSTLDAAEVLFCTGFLVCNREDIELLQGVNWLAPFGVNLSRNVTNSLLNPSQGYAVALDLEHAADWTGSDFRYDRVQTEATWYDRVALSSVFAARVRAGWVGSGGFTEALTGTGTRGVVHPEKRFYGGGANSVRGFAQSRLGPRVLTVTRVRRLLEDTDPGSACSPAEVIDLSCDASHLSEPAVVPRPTGGTRVLEGNVEIRFPLTATLQGVTFTDFGQVWGVDERIDLAALEFAPGLGVRFLSPIGPLRVDVAYRFRGGEDLPVVTSQIRPFDPARDDPQRDQLRIFDSMGEEVQIPFVLTDALALLDPRVRFGESKPLSLSRLQLHLSIGQAF